MYQVSYSGLVALPLTSPAAGIVSGAPEVRHNSGLVDFFCAEWMRIVWEGPSAGNH